MKKIAVLYGGYSAEHTISVKSGKFVASILDTNKFEIYEILITKDQWLASQNDSIVDKNDFSINVNNHKIKFDAIVNVIHGNPGENGILQSYFDMLNIPYIGCNAFTSALTFNKYYCNKYLSNFQIYISPSIIIRKNEDYSQLINDFIEQHNLPVFVKPSDGGSSFGTTKVKNSNQLNSAIASAFEHTNEVMIEKFIKGREFTCGVVKVNNQIKALTPIEIISKREFFDYEAKYNSALNEEIIPAPIDQTLTLKLQQLSEKIYKLLNCNGIVRMDYILNEQNNEFYFLEVNTIPGMTSESLVPKMLRYDKIDITELYTQMIEELL